MVMMEYPTVRVKMYENKDSMKQLFEQIKKFKLKAFVFIE